MITTDDLHRYRFADPFVPFVVTLKDGTEILVRRPLAIGWQPVTEKGGASLRDGSLVFFRVSDIDQIEPLGTGQR